MNKNEFNKFKKDVIKIKENEFFNIKNLAEIFPLDFKKGEYSKYWTLVKQDGTSLLPEHCSQGDTYFEYIDNTLFESYCYGTNKSTPKIYNYKGEIIHKGSIYPIQLLNNNFYIVQQSSYPAKYNLCELKDNVFISITTCYNSINRVNDSTLNLVTISRKNNNQNYYIDYLYDIRYKKPIKVVNKKEWSFIVKNNKLIPSRLASKYCEYENWLDDNGALQSQYTEDYKEQLKLQERRKDTKYLYTHKDLQTYKNSLIYFDLQYSEFLHFEKNKYLILPLGNICLEYMQIGLGLIQIKDKKLANFLSHKMKTFPNLSGINISATSCYGKIIFEDNNNKIEEIIKPHSVYRLSTNDKIDTLKEILNWRFYYDINFKILSNDEYFKDIKIKTGSKQVWLDNLNNLIDWFSSIEQLTLKEFKDNENRI